jgi:hypothetical protein
MNRSTPDVKVVDWMEQASNEQYTALSLARRRAAWLDEARRYQQEHKFICATLLLRRSLAAAFFAPSWRIDSQSRS